MAMDYGQQAFSAMKAAEVARAAENRMNEEGEKVASQGAAPDTLAAIKEQEANMAAEMGNAPAPEAEAEADEADEELHGDAEEESEEAPEE